MKLKEPLLYWLKPGKIQPINYTLFILILVGSSIVRYRVGVNSLNQKLRVEELNGALAYGFVRLTAADLSAVHEAISRADKLLYENKKNAR